MRTVYANRGAGLEELIDWANKQYKDKGFAIVNKVPTPVKILRIIKNRVNGFLESKSTVDYIGVIPGGKMVAFDCKETKGNNFPLKNIHEHQIIYLGLVNYYGGYAFLVVNFVDHGKYFRLPYTVLKDYWDRWKANGGKKGCASIPIEEFTALRKELRQRDGIALDYLEGLIQI